MADAPRTDDEKLVFETSGEVDVTPSFDNMGLKEELVRGIYAYGQRERETGRRPPLLRLALLRDGRVHLCQHAVRSGVARFRVAGRDIDRGMYGGDGLGWRPMPARCAPLLRPAPAAAAGRGVVGRAARWCP